MATFMRTVAVGKVREEIDATGSLAAFEAADRGLKPGITATRRRGS